MTVDPPACLRCKHFRPKALGPSCDAFPHPARIPDRIWLFGDPHAKPVEGDHGIRFEPKPETK